MVHCHTPNETTPLEDQAAALNEQYLNGHFQQATPSAIWAVMLH